MREKSSRSARVMQSWLLALTSACIANHM